MWFVLLWPLLLGAAHASTTECYTQSGPPYNGTLNRTATGEPCLPWSEFTHLRLRSMWNASVLQEHSNYCRNPDDDPRGPWCMVTRAKFGTCAVPHCEHLVDCYEGVGEDYLGDVSVTESGQICAPWADVIRSSIFSPGTPHLVIVNYTSPTNRTPLSSFESSVANFRSCRNPEGRMAKPWCYVTASNPGGILYHSNVGYRKAPCKVDMCDQSSHMGLPLDFGDECPPGFMTQVGKTTSPHGEISTVYCVLTAKGLRKTEKGRFKSFCMFLLNQNRETCPKGFDMKRTFMRTKLKAKGKFSMFRQEGFTSIWISLCCTNGSHAERRMEFPRSSVAYKSANSRSAAGPWLRMENHRGADLADVMNDDPSVPASKETPIFVSIERCPPVNGTRRKIFTMGTYHPSNLTATLLDYGYYTSLCTYYEEQRPSSHSEQASETLIPSILVEGKTCPPHFSLAPSSKAYHVFYYLRAAFILCKPDGIYRHDAIDKMLPDGNQCFISHTPDEVKRDAKKAGGGVKGESGNESDDDDDGLTSNKRYECPTGFDTSELRWSGGNASAHGYESINIFFCCRRGASSSTKDSSKKPASESHQILSPQTYPLPFYLRSVPTFAVLILGGSCPDYSDQGAKLTADFRPTMQTESYMTLELIGQNNPVDFVESMSGVRAVLALCKYSQPREEVGVLSPQGFCHGVGERRVPTVHTLHDSGTTCAVNVTNVVFPSGSYCFYRTAKVCPPGLPELQTSVFEGLVRSFLLQTMLVPSPALNDEKELCCQSEESLGAIEMPLNITASFALPALQASCQSFIGFTVDQSKGFCEYTPITEQPESILVWPRRVFPSNLRGKTEIVLTCSDNWALNTVSRARNFMMRHRRLWLIPTPMQDFSSNDAMELCYNEVRGTEVPTRTENGFLDYCVVAFAVCPNEDFETVSAFPYQQYVVCCVKQPPEAQNTPTTFQTVSTWPEQVRAIVTLGRKRPGDEEKVKDLAGPTELHRDLRQPETDHGCPEFEQYSVIRRFVKMWRPKRYKTLFSRPSIHQLLNVTKAAGDDKEAFAKRTGMWLQDGLLHAIFCEYQTNRPAEANTDITWPVDNYAIPQPVTGCPPAFTSTDFIHLHGRNGFHYSQPIHLAGDFIAHSRAVKLRYCHQEFDPSPSHWNKKHASSLPPGHYCVLLVGRRCPAGFTAGSLSVFEGLLTPNETHKEGGIDISDLPTGTESSAHNAPRIFRDKVEKGDTGLTFDRVTYMFCCRADSPSASIPITGFPNDTGPFYLFRAGETCQEIAGLRATEEYICMDAPEFLVGTVQMTQMEVVDKTYHIEGFTPTLSMSTDHCNVKINLCYYESAIPEPEPEPQEEKNNGSAWPLGSYSLLTTIREDGTLACPPGFSLAIRYNIRPDVIANTFFRPMSFSEYFTQKPTATDDMLASNGTIMPTLHTCERNASDVPEAYNLTAFPDWPPGNYCVLMDLHTRSCPQGLHRFTRQLAELCCHTGSSGPLAPVKLPFIGDFFLMGAFDEPDLTCLPIENTHVEKYVVLLFSAVDPHIHSLCHYLPLEWLQTSRTWPRGDYLLPIGKRGQQIPSISNDVEHATELTKFSCPTGFHRLLHEYEIYDEEFEGSTGEVPSDASASQVMLHFCQRDKEDPEGAKNVPWPKGDYCVIVNGAICPPEMRASNELVMRIPRSYLRAIHNATDYGEIKEGQSITMPVGSRQVTYYSVCCREDKQLLVDLPTFSGGMYMPAGSSLCSSIPGTFIEHEQVTTFLDPTLLDPYMNDNEDAQDMGIKQQGWMPPPFEEPGVMTLCYYHQMQKITKDGKSEDGNMLHELLEPGSTALSLWLAGECGCAENAYCRPFKRFSCKCKKGHFGDGVRVCRPVTPLTDPCANLCHKDAECKTRRKHSFISRTKEETACVCKPGFVGDGFNCLPQCSAHKCQPFSQCKIRKGVPTCVCVPGTIEDGEECHFDIYSSFQKEKILPQYMLQHLSCFDDEVFKALILQKPKRIFIIFSPPKLLKTCDEIASHIAMLPDEAEYQRFITSQSYNLISLNGSLIVINNTGALTANGDAIQNKPKLFTNGRLYYTSAPLAHIPAPDRSSTIMSASIIVPCLIVLFLLVVVVFILKRRRPQLKIFNLRRPRFQRIGVGHQASWRGSDGVLIASEDNEE
uniref:Kringle domain-containing protein n=1 Tax=Mesocestoides corti TaxID=53468 RepID=A0A5K3EJ85_MESCO